MNVEIVASGTELLLGEIVDTNSAYIARSLREIGANVFFKTVVGDNLDRMASVLEIALNRSDQVIITGGLGPTADDITRDAIAKVTQRPLQLDEYQLERIEAMFARWGRDTEVGENNRRQAYLPQGAIGVDNPVGTAPGFIIEEPHGTIIALPGVPREMKHLMQTEVIPYLRTRIAEPAIIVAKNLRTVGIGESSIDSALGELMLRSNPTVGLAAHAGQTDIRITAKAPNETEAQRLIAEVEAEVRQRMDDYVYGEAEETVEEVAIGFLRQRCWRLALLETNTLGDIASRIEAVPGAEDLLTQHIIWKDDNPHELAMLDLPRELADSAYTLDGAKVIAQALRDKTDADIALAILGTTGADEGVYGSQTGQTFLGMALRDGVEQQDFLFGGVEKTARRWIGNRTLDWLRRVARDGHL